MLSLIVCSAVSNAQFIMDLIDTTKQMGKGMLKIYEKYDHLKISGYMQPQWQVAQAAGANTYSGGNFSTFSNNRFMLRRGRIKFEYVDFPEKKGPSLQFVFQFDGTEKGVAIRDFWGRILENHYKVFSFTAGMFPRPFGYEVNLSSSERESPERGRMSQILMKGERDLGAMGSFEPRLKTHSLYNLKIDIGVFNGQGINSSAEMDSYKDLVGRISLKPVDLSSKIKFSAGTSGFNGGFRQNTAYVYSTVNKMLVVD
ncbi:MAG: porin, partial [Ferruginibacter sp.]